MSPLKAASNAAEIAMSPIVATLAVALILGGLGWVATTLISHGTTLAGIEEALKGLHDGQVRIETTLVGRIDENAKALAAQANELAKIQQSQEDARKIKAEDDHDDRRDRMR